MAERTGRKSAQKEKTLGQQFGSLKTVPVEPFDNSVRANLSTHIERHVRMALLAGHFEPGDRISLISIAEALGTSVTPVREAISRLAAVQALELVPGQIARVPAFDGQRYAELRDIRVAVECLAVERAALRVTKSELAGIKKALNAFLKASRKGSVEKMLLASRDYRFMIYEATRMPALVGIIENLWLRSAPSFRLMYGRNSRDEYLEENYSKLYQALEDQDVAGARYLVEKSISVGAGRLIAMVDHERH